MDELLSRYGNPTPVSGITDIVVGFNSCTCSGNQVDATKEVGVEMICSEFENLSNDTTSSLYNYHRQSHLVEHCSIDWQLLMEN